MRTLRSDGEPIGQRGQGTRAQRDESGLITLPVFHAEGALLQVNMGQPQPEKLRAAKAGEDHDRQRGGVTRGLGDGRLPARSLQQRFGFLGREAGGQVRPALRHGHAHEGIALGVPVVPHVLPERAQGGQVAGDAGHAEVPATEPRDVLPDGLPVNGLHQGFTACVGEAEEKLPEVGAVSCERLGAAVALQVEVGEELIVYGLQFHQAALPSGCAAHGPSGRGGPGRREKRRCKFTTSAHLRKSA